ncbi:hypothetical protein RUM43_004240 [Polyplax serrata]|uniref:Vacuolar protein-sorting-associated protein 25 n=1 Tax=Polyplax serrata TaxID=468196 RepID=A0AAN8SAP0_POLSC
MEEDFEWPWQYNFPPFFTIQLNSETLKQQLQAWKQLVLDYLKAKKQSLLDVREAQQTPLFRNTTINRQLSVEGIIKIMEELSKTGHAEFIDKSKNRWYIYWEPLEELSSAVYRWASNNGFIGSVCTLYELAEGENTTDEIFYHLEEDVLLKVLKKLEEENKAEIMMFDDSKGVKFF